MSTYPADVAEFVKAPRWWRTEIFTEIMQSADGVGDLLRGLESRGRTPFFVLDGALKGQTAFDRLFGASADKFVFDATSSEPKTEDIDRVVEMVKTSPRHPDTVVGVGGGGTMDLTKAVSICTANPKKAEDYQGFGLEMERGTDIWVMPTLQGTGAEVTPIAVLRGPKRKLGINNRHTAPTVAVLDPQLSAGVPKRARFYTMMDCWFHLFEISQSKTSAPSAVEDAVEGRKLAASVLREGVGEYSVPRAIRMAMASLLGGAASITGRVGVSHALSYGLSNCGPKLPHSVAVTISMLASRDIYGEGYDEAVELLAANDMPHPRAADFGIGAEHIEKMTTTALGMDKLWQSHYGDDWQKVVDHDFIAGLYEKIVNA